MKKVSSQLPGLDPTLALVSVESNVMGSTPRSWGRVTTKVWVGNIKALKSREALSEHLQSFLYPPAFLTSIWGFAS